MKTPDLEKLKALAEGNSSNGFTAMAVRTKDVLAMIERIEKLEKVASLAACYVDMPCYCDDAVLNNGTGICTPCELHMALNEVKETPPSEGQ